MVWSAFKRVALRFPLFSTLVLIKRFPVVFPVVDGGVVTDTGDDCISGAENMSLKSGDVTAIHTGTTSAELCRRSLNAGVDM